jgi:hypothetical protein
LEAGVVKVVALAVPFRGERDFFDSDSSFLETFLGGDDSFFGVSCAAGCFLSTSGETTARDDCFRIAGRPRLRGLLALASSERSELEDALSGVTKGIDSEKVGCVPVVRVLVMYRLAAFVGVDIAKVNDGDSLEVTNKKRHKLLVLDLPVVRSLAIGRCRCTVPLPEADNDNNDSER